VAGLLAVTFFTGTVKDRFVCKLDKATPLLLIIPVVAGIEALSVANTGMLPFGAALTTALFQTSVIACLSIAAVISPSPFVGKVASTCDKEFIFRPRVYTIFIKFLFFSMGGLKTAQTLINNSE
jgi:hypothetical protein